MVGTSLFIGEHTHFATCRSVLFEIWLQYLASCIPVGQGLYTQFTRLFHFCRSGWVWLVRLPYTNGLWLINIPADLSGYFHVGTRNKNSREIPRCLLLGHGGGYTVV